MPMTRGLYGLAVLSVASIAVGASRVAAPNDASAPGPAVEPGEAAPRVKKKEKKSPPLSRAPSNEAAVVKANEDRITCLRQDDLDLVKPLEQSHMLRLVAPVFSDTSGDIYVSANSIWIKQVSLKVQLKRKGKHRFSFEVYGDAPCCDHLWAKDKVEDAAAIEFEIEGLDVLLRNTWMSWGADRIADREKLNKRQEGWVKMKLFGEGQARVVPETGMWQIELLKKETQPFHVHLDQQKTVEKALGFVGLDAIIMKALWPLVAELIPTSYAASLNFLDSKELDASMTVSVTGGMKAPGAPLELELGGGFNFTVIPRRLMEVLLENFDPVKLTEKRLERVFASTDLTKGWEENRETIGRLLRRYGLQVDWVEEFLKTGGHDEAELKRHLMQAAKHGADALVKSMRPLMHHYDQFEEAIANGLSVDIVSKGGWSKLRDGNSMLFALGDGQKDARPSKKNATAPAIEVPQRMMGHLCEVLGLRRDFMVPPKGDERSTFKHSMLSFVDGALEVKGTELENWRVRLDAPKLDGVPLIGEGVPGALAQPSNGAVAQGPAPTAPKVKKPRIWKMNGKFKDLAMKVPKRLFNGVDLMWESSTSRFTRDGTLQISLGNAGMQLRVVSDEKTRPPLPDVPDKPRKGDVSQIDGPLPENLERPTRARSRTNIAEEFPEASFTTSVNMKGITNALEFELGIHGSVSINVNKAVRGAFASYVREEHGYPFFAERFQRRMVNQEPGLPMESEVVAVLSCGYLRLLSSAPTADNPFAAVDFDPAHGQLQIDVSQYTALPEATEHMDGELLCMRLYTNGVVPRQADHGRRVLGGAGYLPVEELLCGESEKMIGLGMAMGFQIARFRSDEVKSLAWNHGTHKADEPQYVLAEGRKNIGLDVIIAPLQVEHVDHI